MIHENMPLFITTITILAILCLVIGIFLLLTKRMVKAEYIGIERIWQLVVINTLLTLMVFVGAPLFVYIIKYQLGLLAT